MRRSVNSLSLLLQRSLVLADDILDASDHVERVLGDGVVLAVEDLLESVNGLLEGDEAALDTGEDLGDSEWLG